jgi:hypothetical protein
VNLLSSLEATTPARLLPPCAESVLALAELARHQSRQPLAPLLRRDPGLWAAALASRAESAPDRAPPDRAPPDRAAPDRAPPDRAAPDRAAPDRAPPDRAPPAEHTGCDDGDVALAQRLLGDILARPRLGFADWTSSAARLAWQAANLGADAARRLAQRLDLSAAGLETLGCFLFLGHLVQAQEGDPSLHALEPFQLMRLLARRWSWPHWLREPLTAFDPRLPPPRAAAVGRPLACLHLAQALVARALPELELGPGADVPRLLESLGLPPGALAELGAAPAVLPTPPLALPAPAAELFCRALRCAEPPAAAGSADVLLRLEQELETAQARLGDLQADVEGRLRDRKLEALAEFAAGAAHEINNPLAVISAQAQHLLKSEESLERARALERIILQARRIHQVLRDLMLYARPPRPKLTTLRLDALLAAALRQVAEPAEARDIELQKAERFAGV